VFGKNNKKSEISDTKIIWFWGFIGVVFSIVGTLPFYVAKKVDKTEKKKPIIFLALLILALIFSLILALILWIIL
jgi:H+/Cl- antiporter ClcA